MILGDSLIGPDMIQPFDPERVQPASYDVRLGKHFKVMKPVPVIDPEQPSPEGMWEELDIGVGRAFLFPSGGFALATTMERLTLNPRLVGTFTGKSSLGRLGLMVHLTAGHCDPAFEGKVTMELANWAPSSILLRPGMPIGQIIFSECRGVERPYGHPSRRSKYQHQIDATESRMWRDSIQ